MVRCEICGDEGETKCTPQANCLNISLAMETAAKKIEPMAFHYWLMKVSEGNPVKIAEVLTNEIINNQNPQAFELLEATGDKNFTPDTFIKASELVRTICTLHP